MPTPSTYENIQQVPCVTDFSSRNAVVTSDSYMKNCFVEVDGQTAYAVKRPGLGLYKTIGGQTGPSFGAYQVQGVTSDDLNDASIFVMDDLVAMLTSQLTLYTGSIPYTSFGGQPYRVVPTTVAGTPGNCLLQATELFRSVTIGGPVVTAISLASLGLTTSIGLVPSLSELNSTYYLLTNTGKLYSTTDFTTWPALNFLQVDPTLGAPVALVRHLTYLIAFCSQGTIAYYDAGISPGSPLAPVPNAVFLEGMAIDGAWTATSSIDDELFWVGQGASAGFSVKQMVGLSITEISTPAVNRLLEYYMPLLGKANGAFTLPYLRKIYPRGLTFKNSGHSFYCLTFPTFSYTDGVLITVPGISLVYDLRIKIWTIWTQNTGVNEREWQPIFTSFLAGPNVQLFFDQGSGEIQTLSNSTYQDRGQVINFQIQTDLFNWGNQRRKFIPATYLQADTLSSTVVIEWTDDDYNTFSTAQTISTAKAKKQIVRCGSTTQRGWRLTHTDNTAMRFYGLEVEVVPGAL